jgi:hypothetical protein
MIPRRFRISALFLATTLAAGCVHYWKPNAVKRPIAENGVVLFHERMNDQQFDDINNSIGLRSHLATEMMNVIRGCRDKYGLFVSSEQKVAMCEPHGITLIYHTRYSKGDATELFTWEVYGDRAHLVKYAVSAGLQDIPGDLPYVCPENGKP